MRRKIIHAITRTPAEEAVHSRAAAADDVLGVRVSTHEVVWPHLFRREYMPFREIVWAYLSIKETEMQTGEFDGGCLLDVRLVLFNDEGRFAAIKFDRPAYGEAVIGLLQAAAPHIAIGFTPENRQKFPFETPSWHK